MPGFAVDSDRRAAPVADALLHRLAVRASGSTRRAARRRTARASSCSTGRTRSSTRWSPATGDWRSAGFVPAGQGFTAPPVAVVEPAHPGPLPSAHSLLAVDPPGAAVVTAVKPVGTPLASGTSPTPPAEALAVRLYEAHGRPVTARLRLAGGVVAAERADLLDRPTGPLAVGPDGAVEVPLAPCEVATVVLRPAAAAAGDEPLVPEPAGVVPARYWLENAGPAPAGNLPVSVHASPSRAVGPVELRVSVASSLADAEWTGVVTVTAPEGWTSGRPPGRSRFRRTAGPRRRCG